VSQVRNMARGLAPVALNDESLGEALGQLTEEMTALYGVSCEFSAPTTARSESLALPKESSSAGGATPPAEPNHRNSPRLHSIISLDQKTKEQLYLIAREAVNNAARHAEAERITIQLNSDDSGWALCVEDNGKGLPCSVPKALLQGLPKTQPAEEGMGIRIMRHRARLIGAKFNITSTPDQGTCIQVVG